jgi:hypothetical protein
MPPDLVAFLVRNTLASWVVNTEFAAPVLIWIFALHHRRRHPRLSRFMTWPVVSLLIAGLARQVYEQFLVPWAVVSGTVQPRGLVVVVVQIVFSAALFVGYGGLLWALYYRRLVPGPGDPFAEQDSDRSDTAPSGQ